MWLIPRLAKFTASHPLVDVRLSATLDVLDLARSQIDVAVRFRPIRDATERPLLEETVQPVCSPALLRDPKNPLKKPADLANHTLLTIAGQGRRSASITSRLRRMRRAMPMRRILRNGCRKWQIQL